ncbi:MAG: hypothetical protein R2865_02580 [Deinococcales bacterium]
MTLSSMPCKRVFLNLLMAPIVPSSPYFNDAIPHYDVDLEKANALLDEAGYPKGQMGHALP